MQPALKASVVLPTHGRRASLLRVLRALAVQTVPGQEFEVVVVCDGDVDGSVVACRTLAPELPYTLHVLEQPNQGPAAARNVGVAKACAEVIVFLDDDVVPDKHLLAAHLAAHADQRCRVTIGPLLPPQDKRLNLWGAWEEYVLCRQYDAMQAGLWQPTYRQFYTGNAALRKEHIIAAGGFNATFLRAEDVELALRLDQRGLEFVFLPEARGWHYVRRSFASWLRIPVAYGAADIAMARNGRPQVLETVVAGYHSRSLGVRLLTMLCLGRPVVARYVVLLLGIFVQTANRWHAMRVGSVGCSLIFNLCYYNNIALSLGGRSAFLGLLRGQAGAATMLRRLDDQRHSG